MGGMAHDGVGGLVWGILPTPKARALIGGTMMVIRVYRGSPLAERLADGALLKNVHVEYTHTALYIVFFIPSDPDLFKMLSLEVEQAEISPSFETMLEATTWIAQCEGRGSVH